ncbi:MAG: YIP1 family protein [Chloroflexi bacterium]|nr:YIP1 family protein [Chloroflexota bacterium]
MIERMIGALQLKSSTFEEVEADTKATPQAMLVVILVAIATGLAGLQVADTGVLGLVLGIVVALAGWAVWAGITYFVGTTIFKTEATQADWGQLARVLGFAQTPGIFKVIGVIPALGGDVSRIIVFAIFAWQLAAMVVAVRAALDYTSTLRAIGVVVVGFVPYFVFLLLISLFV